MGSQYAFPVDVWSLGVLAFMLLSGCAPFDTSDAQLEERQVCTAAAATRLPPPTHYPPFDCTPRARACTGCSSYLALAPLELPRLTSPRATSPYLPLRMAMVAHGST